MRTLSTNRFLTNLSYRDSEKNSGLYHIPGQIQHNWKHLMPAYYLYMRRNTIRKKTLSSLHMVFVSIFFSNQESYPRTFYCSVFCQYRSVGFDIQSLYKSTKAVLLPYVLFPYTPVLLIVSLLKIPIFEVPSYIHWRE